ncbi:hypothetical protein BSKO_08761 [Bryopsis sp. KO-2023]|nr:hypothetical protein BSKO_08761 [Bryopsis sp. KO-2023]
MSVQDTLPSWFVVEEAESTRGTQGVFLKARDCRLSETQPKRELVAIKCIPRGVAVTGEVQDEVLTLRQLWHKHFVGFREVFLTKTHLCMVFEYAHRGSVFDLVRKKRRLPEELSRWVFQQLITAVDYLHQLKIVNRDIKLNNLLIDGEGGCPIVLCDFGFTKLTSVDSDSHLGPGYVAPDFEYRNGKAFDPKAADVWSCGVCLFYMLYGAFFAVKHNHLEHGRGSYKVPDMEVVIPDRVNGSGDIASEQCRDFLRKVLEVNPENRITMDEIWTHEWFRKDLPEGSREYNLLTTNSEMLREHYGEVQSKDDILNIIDMAKKP